MRRGHDHDPRERFHLLPNGERLIAGPGRGVHDHVVEIAPHDVGEKLTDQSDLHRSTPDERLVRLIPDVCDARHRQVGHHLDRLDRFLIAGESHRLDPKHLGDVGSVDIGVEEAYAEVHVGERPREVNADR